MRNAITQPMIRSERTIRTRTAGALLLFAMTPLTSSAEIVQAGAGSYSTVMPAEFKPLPEKIHRTAEFTGPTITNQWWSSMVWQEFSSNLFALPLGMVCSPQGLAITYPGAAIVANDQAIMGGGVTTEGDILIGLTSASPFKSADVAGHSDWFVTASFSAGDATLRTSIGQGSPFIFCTFSGAQPVLRFSDRPQIWHGGDKDAVLGVTVKGNHYGVFAASGTAWSGLDGSVFTNQAGDKTWFSVALLPDNKPDTLALFQRYAHNHVVDTRLEQQVVPGKVKSTYSYKTKAMEGDGSGTIFALYPHQWKYTPDKLTGLTYSSVRGTMKVGEGDAFHTAVPIQGVLPTLPAEGIRDRERILEYLREAAKGEPAPIADTYWEGKHLGKLATLAGIAESAGDAELRKSFIDEIKRRLENWFTAKPGGEAPMFYYNSTWGTLIGNKPSYGSDMPLNDHHFHYGYFIRAAAEVARLDPAWAKKWQDMVLLVIRDIASADRGDKMFPYMRCFDKFAGHSWASGNAEFADGNNQESSSESLNAWYGMMLWGAAMGDDKIRDTGICLFNTERTAVEEYWFDVSGTNFPKDFSQVALGMIWGGKGAFATWFSGDIDHIHGINWLPFTPASIYMGRHPEYVKKNFERIASKRPEGRDFNNGWGDLVVMFGALHDPAFAADHMDNNPDRKVEGGNTLAFMDHWIGTLHTLGINDTGVTADHPFSNIYNKNGRKSYAVYNHGDTPLNVSFSDGKKLIAKPGALTTAIAPH